MLAGFLLTAARNWTKRETVRGPALALLLATWCAGRLVALRSGDVPAAVGPILDGLFYIGVAAAALRAIVPARNWRNLALPLLLLTIGACDVTVHLAAGGHIEPVNARRALFLSLDAAAIIILIIGGRIIPLFTRNALKITVRPRGWFDHLGVAALAVCAAARLVAPASTATSSLLVCAGVVNIARLWGWGGSGTLTNPLLWVLHAGWLLVALGYGLAGIAGFTPRIAPSAATHLYTVGGIGVLTLGMMARVALGHTGRALIAPKVVAFGFVLLLAATAIRVGLPIVSPLRTPRPGGFPAFCGPQHLLCLLRATRRFCCPRGPTENRVEH